MQIFWTECTPNEKEFHMICKVTYDTQVCRVSTISYGVNLVLPEYCGISTRKDMNMLSYNFAM